MIYLHHSHSRLAD